ncbi:MAG: hypothetical protein P4L42_06565 [Desulfocapsaceae bacterium]|nr:hypothetical protein [Desulfocapsaceae bacterium]
MANAKSDIIQQDSPTVRVPSLPLAYGRVVYTYNENSPKKLYIVGISHRDSKNCLNGDNTVKTQLEIYRIGEWLKQNNQLDILLPEGFFNPANAISNPPPAQQRVSLDNTVLERQLADNSRFVNAEMLLMEQFQIPAGQVEDRPLYNAVLNRMLQLEDNAADPASCRCLKAEIDSLQEKRTAAILQKIPAAIDEEFRDGKKRSENAMFTIGLNHIGTIIRYLERNKIQIQSSTSPSATQNNDVADLNLLKEGFGIIVIIPNTLTHDPEALKMTNLENLSSNI